MAVQTATKPSLTLKRRLKAPPDKVFAAWTDPDKVKRWMGPGEVKVLKVEFNDLAPAQSPPVAQEQEYRHIPRCLGFVRVI